MIDILYGLSERLIAAANNDWAIFLLIAVSFTEAIFFWIPPDPLLIAISLARTDIVPWLVVSATISSVIGAVFGHWLGGLIGYPLLRRLFSSRSVDLAQGWFRRYGVLAVFIAAFTPVPYKVIAITAGALDFNRFRFIVASLAGRGLRFAIIGLLIYWFGQDIKEFLDRDFDVVITVTTTLLVVAASAWILLRIFARRKGPPVKD